MKPEQALEMLYQATTVANLPLAQHQQLYQAYLILKPKNEKIQRNSGGQQKPEPKK
jgi:hypothetical protein